MLIDVMSRALMMWGSFVRAPYLDNKSVHKCSCLHSSNLENCSKDRRRGAVYWWRATRTESTSEQGGNDLQIVLECLRYHNEVLSC